MSLQESEHSEYRSLLTEATMDCGVDRQAAPITDKMAKPRRNESFIDRKPFAQEHDGHDSLVRTRT